MLASCSYPHLDEIKVDDAHLPSSTETERIGTQKTDLFVFVGERIEVVEFKPEGEILMDQAYKARYRVIENVFGAFDGNTIEFEAYDHYGFPPFAKFKNVLLFVSKHEGKLYHEKYQYFDVYQTLEGKWAGCGDPHSRHEVHRKPFTPKQLEFALPVVFDLTKLTDKQIKQLYPTPYFEVNGKKARCRMGAYVDELFSIKRNGVLTARGLF